MIKSVVNKIVLADMCCGCGTCAGICPSDSLEMAFNKYGEYQPHLIGECSDCGLCLKVCPFNDNTEDELADGLFSLVLNIKKDDTLGYYHTCMMGYANRDGIREKGASGGMVTLLLTLLFEQGKIDGAVVVGPSDRKGIRFESRIVRSVEEIQASAKSKYYPIEHSRVLKQILKEDGKYAVVGLPCHIYGIRKAQKHSKKLRERIKYILGMVCGHGVSASFTDFLIDCTGVARDAVKTIDYRDKTGTERSLNYSFAITPKDYGNRCIRLPFQESILGQVWLKRMFVPNVCDYCDDVFSELADATFMDAWLQEQIKDPKGNSIVIVRNPTIARLLFDANESGQCRLTEIDKETAIRSQHGGIEYKRNQIRGRLWFVRNKKRWVPERRKIPERLGRPTEMKGIRITEWNKWISKRVYNVSLLRRFLGSNLVSLCLPIAGGRLRDALPQWIRLPLSFIKKKLKIFGGHNE